MIHINRSTPFHHEQYEGQVKIQQWITRKKMEKKKTCYPKMVILVHLPWLDVLIGTHSPEYDQSCQNAHQSYFIFFCFGDPKYRLLTSYCTQGINNLMQSRFESLTSHIKQAFSFWSSNNSTVWCHKSSCPYLRITRSQKKNFIQNSKGNPKSKSSLVLDP